MSANANIMDKLVGMTPDELALLRKVNEVGAVSADELAVKLRRPGGDLLPAIDNLVKRELLQVRTIENDGEKTKIYLTARNVRPLL